MDELEKVQNQIKILKIRLRILKKTKYDNGKFWNHCSWCNESWKQRKKDKPRRCPKCFRVGWEEGKTKHQYNLSEIEIGESKTIPYALLPDDNLDNVKIARMLNTIDSYSSRTKRKFRREGKPWFLLLTRIS